MSEPNPTTLKVLDAESVGSCEPDSDYCVLPGAAAVDDPDEASQDGSAGPDEDD